MVQLIWNCEIIALFGQSPLKETPQPTNCQLKSNSLYLKLRRLIVKMKTKDWLHWLLKILSKPHPTEPTAN